MSDDPAQENERENAFWIAYGGHPEPSVWPEGDWCTYCHTYHDEGDDCAA